MERQLLQGMAASRTRMNAANTAIREFGHAFARANLAMKGMRNKHDLRAAMTAANEDLRRQGYYSPLG